MNRIQAIIFDFDGVILDTETPYYISWQEIYQEHNLTISLSEWAAFIGRSPNLLDPLKYLEKNVKGSIDRKSILSRRAQREFELLESETILPGVESYILEAKTMNMKLAIASSSDESWVKRHLSRFDLTDQFDCIKSAEDVKYTKPNPELYKSVLAELRLQADQAIALEDSPNGILAAKRAGIYCVGIPNNVTRHFSFSHADLILMSLADISLEKLLIIAQERPDGRPCLGAR